VTPDFFTHSNSSTARDHLMTLDRIFKSQSRRPCSLFRTGTEQPTAPHVAR
jgi:hypothetical protein